MGTRAEIIGTSGNADRRVKVIEENPWGAPRWRERGVRRKPREGGGIGETSHVKPCREVSRVKSEPAGGSHRRGSSGRYRQRIRGRRRVSPSLHF